MTLNIDVNIDPEEVEQAIVQAVVDSALGKRINDEVERLLKLSTPWHNHPVTKAIETEVMIIIRNIVREEYRDAIREQVKKYLTEERIEEMAANALNEYLAK